MNWFRRGSVWVAAALLLLAQGQAGLPRSVRADASFAGHYDTIPDFAASSTIQSAGSGPWSSPSTWSPARQPNASDVVQIESGHTVTVDGAAAARTIGVTVGGILSFRTDASTALTVGTLEVDPGGTLLVGTASSPVQAGVTATITIADQPLNPAADPTQWGTGLIAIDARVQMAGAPLTPTFSRLAAEPHRGDSTLSLAEPVSGWRSGDRLVLPDSRDLPGTSNQDPQPHREERTLASASGDGRTLVLDRSLDFDHLGARNMAGGLDFLPQVADLSRNVIIRSANPVGTRGHTAFIGRSDVDIRNVLFRDLGRTTTNPIDNTTFNPDGSVAHFGSNQLGRYPFHFHHLMGPLQTPADGYQVTAIDNSVDGGSSDDWYRGGITIHDTHYGLIKDNTVYNVGGSGYYLEDGSESFNLLEHNFVMRVNGMSGESNASDPGVQGWGFWSRGPNNSFRNNSCTTDMPTCYIFFVDCCGGFSQIHVPNFKGADTYIDGQYTPSDLQAMAILEFSGNEAYGAIGEGLEIWTVGTSVESAPETVIKDFRVWHASGPAYFGYPTNHITFDHYVVRGDPQLLAGYGWYMIDYSSQQMLIRNADIQGEQVGIVEPSSQVTPLVVQDSYLNNATDFWSFTMSCGCPPIGMSPKKAVFRNVKFGDRTKMNLEWSEYGGLRFNLIQKDEVLVYDYNQVPGDSFQAYFLEQAPDHVMRQTDDLVLGSPEAGLTNQQNWTKYNIAEAGAVAPCSTTREGILGFTCAIATPPRTPDPGAYRPLVPARILDTRQSNPLGAQSTLDLQVAGRGGVPATGVGAAVLNVTVVSPSQNSYLTLYPTGADRPVASNLNFSQGQTRANLSVTALGNAGRVSVYNDQGMVQVVVDVNGYFVAGQSGDNAGLFVPLEAPVRILDTRGATGGHPGRLGPGERFALGVAGQAGIPATGVEGVILNVTAVSGSQDSYVTVWPTVAERPLASNLNFGAGQNLPNRVFARLGPDGRVQLYNDQGSADAVVDVMGWFGDGSGGVQGSIYHAVAPARILDTRPDSALGPGESRQLMVAGHGDMPGTGAVAVVANVTATEGSQASYLTLYPSGAARPTASDLNFRAGETAPNLAVVKLGADGAVLIYNDQDRAQALFDVAGWFG